MFLTTKYKNPATEGLCRREEIEMNRQDELKNMLEEVNQIEKTKTEIESAEDRIKKSELYKHYSLIKKVRSTTVQGSELYTLKGTREVYLPLHEAMGKMPVEKYIKGIDKDDLAIITCGIHNHREYQKIMLDEFEKEDTIELLYIVKNGLDRRTIEDAGKKIIQVNKDNPEIYTDIVLPIL